MGEWTPRSSIRTTTIGIRIPARLDQLTMLRALAETLSLIADFALDEVTDIRLALDEVATSLIMIAVPGSILDCEYTYDDRRMSVRVRSIASTDAMVDQAGFGWHVVRTLTVSLAAVQAPLDPVAGGYPTTVDFSWVRGVADGG
ncbi:anti-sigma factor [Nocardia sp. NPDC127579]|uniref:anti-sigma factor n=1 Tax=Nocardia sp. NPDC127579 TaxID=3345402 RepID=UPI00363EB721